MDDRLSAARPLIEGAGWAEANLHMIAGDASNRRYARLTKTDGTTAILMDAPPSKKEDVRPFVQIASHLTALGLSAPQVFAQDTDNGFLLLEDLGDTIFARVLETDPSLENSLYEGAIDVLCALHTARLPDLPRYDAALMTDLAALAFDWYQMGALGHVDADARARFCTAMSRALTPLDAKPPVLFLRDYHAENLIWLPERSGPARVGLLDFQDALQGHAAYDLASLLQDARRDVPQRVEAAMIARYTAQAGLDPQPFRAAYDVLALQRNLRILGVFARLSLAYGKAHYVDLIPRVWGLLQRILAQPACADVAPFVHTHLPAPDAPILETLKTKCGTCPIP